MREQSNHRDETLLSGFRQGSEKSFSKVFNADHLVKMAIIHHQFEGIHPFYAGNGRAGRIINIIYLVQKNLLHLPVLYLIRYIIQHKNEYYRHLQQVRETGFTSINHCLHY